MPDANKTETIRTMEMALGEALAQVKPEAQLSWKSMFGGAGYFVDGVMFAAWFGGGLALKLSEADRADLLKVEGAAQSQSAQYIEVPAAFLDDTKQLQPWVARSIEYVNAPRKRKRS